MFFLAMYIALTSQGVPQLGASNNGEMAKTSLKIQLLFNRKSHIGFPLTPRSMTLDDFELL